MSLLWGGVLLLLVGCTGKKSVVPVIPKSKIRMQPWIRESVKVLPEFCRQLVNIDIQIGDNIGEKMLGLVKRLKVPFTMNFYDDKVADKRYQASNSRVIDVITQLARIHDWKLRIDNGSIMISKDEMYTHFHHINFLNNQMKSQVVTGVNANNQINMGSSANLQTNCEYDLLQDIQAYLGFLIKHDIPANDTTGQEQIATYSINRRAGIVSLRATQAMHIQFAKYLSQLDQTLNNQVKIEAKIVQVELKDEFRAGINWSSFKGIGNNFNFNTQGNQGIATFSLGDYGVEGIIEAMQEYGKTSIISKPELTILHNEIGLFKVVKNRVYFKLKAYHIGTATKEMANMSLIRTAEPNIIPVGFSIVIQPTIDNVTGQVNLHIRPTITSVVGEVNDPSVNLDSKNDKQIESKYPVTSAREFDTKLRLKPGEWAVLGGYIDKVQDIGGKGLPGVSVLPLLGTNRYKDNVSEIVCLIRAFPQRGEMSSLDERLCDIYMSDA